MYDMLVFVELQALVPNPMSKYSNWLALERPQICGKLGHSELPIDDGRSSLSKHRR